MTDTPETDNVARGNHVVSTGFAQDLERQLSSARAMVHKLRRQRAVARQFGEQMERERDSARHAFAMATDQCVMAQSFKRQWRECAEILAKQVQYWMDRESDWGPEDEAAMNIFNSLKKANK